MPLSGENFKGPDPRPEKRKKDKATMSALHRKSDRCEVTGKSPASLHHVLPRGQGGDDVPENLVMLEGDGTRGFHGKITNEDEMARMMLGQFLITDRPDVIFYIREKLGEEKGAEWLKRRLYIQ